MLRYLLLLPLSVWGYTEAVTLSEALDGTRSDTLLILDLDDTLIRYPSHLGSTGWFEEFYKSSPSDEFYRVAGLLAQHLDVVSVEAGSSGVIDQLQRRGVAVIGVTRRTLTHPGCPNWAAVTARQVASIGITFDEMPGLYRGMLITGGRPKGEALVEWLNTLNSFPEQICFVDDRCSEVTEVEATLSPHASIRCIWYRYQELFGPQYEGNQASEELLCFLRQIEDDLLAEDKDPWKVDKK